MPFSDALRWNKRYLAKRDFWMQRSPNVLLEQYRYLLPKEGCALDAACGTGNNAVLLAEHGLQVVTLDISQVGLAMARERFALAGYDFAPVLADLEYGCFCDRSFDVILNFNFLSRATFPIYKQMLKPGGLLFFSTFVRNAQRDNPDHYLMPGELQAAFAQLKIIHNAPRKIPRPDDPQLPFEIKEELVVRKPES